MSEESSSQEKDLPASERKLQKSREEGDIARSREFSSAFVMFCVIGSFFVFGGFVSSQFENMFKQMFTLERKDAFDTSTMGVHFIGALVDSALAVAPIFLVAMAAAVIGGFAIGGANWSSKAFQFNIGKLNPIKGLANIFSQNSLAELIKSIAKVIFIGGMGFYLVITDLGSYAGISAMSLKAGILKSLELILHNTFVLAAIYLVIGFSDAPYQIWRHSKKLKMSLEEVKKENKESEGDPHLKGRIRATQREMAKKRMIASVPSADVVVTNPTHFSVAIKYDRDSNSAPKVVAKGVEDVAFKIREVARQAGVQVIEAPPLARALYRHVDIDREIPDALFKAVAKVLAYVYALSNGEEPSVDLPTSDDIPDGMDPAMRATNAS